VRFVDIRAKQKMKKFRRVGMIRRRVYPRFVWLSGKGIEGLRRKLYRTAMCHLTLQKFLSAPGLVKGFML
jgi:hypothetical protein